MPTSFRTLLFLLASWAVLFACTPQELADSHSAKSDSGQVPGKDDPQQPDDPQDPEPEDPQDPEEPGDDPVPPDPQPPVDVPVADLLDVVFQSDGTAVDVSASRMSVQTIAGAQLSTAYNANYKRYAALFTHDMGKETASGYYKIDYSSNTDFQNRIADSHTWEAIVRIDQDPANAGEVKFFSTQEWGGTGFLVSSAQSRNNAFTFLVNTGAWNWAESSIVPAVGRYYHLVGVFDAASSKAELYVDGVCRASVTTTSSTYNPARETCRYVVIGGDPGGAGCSNAWNGAVVLARIYDKAVTADEARLLYEREKSDIPQADVQFLRECIVSPGMKYTIFGSGFKSSDFINIVNKSTAATTRLDGTATSEGFTLTIPASLQAGDYDLVLSRDGWTTLLGSVRFILATAPRAAKTKVVAHRGAFKETGLPENSVAALRAAASMGVYASEMDVWITADDVVVVNHNDSYPTDPNSRYITDTKYTDMGNIRLGNGEPVPTFDEYVRVARECGIRLVVEIKTQRASADNSHTKAENNQRVVDAAIAIVKKYDYESMCDWIAFSFDNCKRIVSKLPNATVQYLNGDKSPAECLAAGIKGIDYHTSTLSLEWAQSAHSLGMLVNVWTIDGTTNLMKYIGWGVDYLTTNSPREAQALCEMNFLTN